MHDVYGDRLTSSPLTGILGVGIKAILGGTFNPPHKGHINAALAAADALKIDSVYLMPCKLPPHKAVSVSEAHRVAMIELCCQENKRLKSELIELALPAPSYTVKTLRALRQQSQDTICFFIGADSLYNLDKWYEWEQLLDYCHLIVMRRGEAAFTPPKSISLWLDKHKAHDSSVINTCKNGAVLLIDTPLYPVSSTEIRNGMAKTSATDITTTSDWVPRSVLNYIEEHQLYKS